MDTEIKATVDAFFSNYPAKKYEKGEILIRPDEVPSHIFYLTDGLVSEYDISQSGNEIVVNTFKPGAFFPMSFAINRGTSPYFFEISKPAVMHRAPAEQVVTFLKANPDVMFDLLSRVYRGTDGVLRRMAHMMGGKAKTRLLFELVNAGHRFGKQNRDGHIFIPLTESDFAKRSGLSRETVSRALHELKALHLVSVQARGVTVIDMDRLEAILGSDL